MIIDCWVICSFWTNIFLIRVAFLSWKMNWNRNFLLKKKWKTFFFSYKNEKRLNCLIGLKIEFQINIILINMEDLALVPAMKVINYLSIEDILKLKLVNKWFGLSMRMWKSEIYLYQLVMIYLIALVHWPTIFWFLSVWSMPEY